MRFEAQAYLIHLGHIFLPEEAPWKATYLKELAAFPRGKYDDQVDSIAQFFAWFRRPRTDSVAGAQIEVFY